MATSNKDATLEVALHSFMAKSFYYSHTPMLIIDQAGRISEINAACRLLLGKDIAGCKGKDFNYFLKQIDSKIDGEFISEKGTALKHLSNPNHHNPNLDVNDLYASETTCRYSSQQFGLAKLMTSELPYVDTVLGQCFGSILNIEVLELEKLNYFRECLSGRWSHEIMWEVYAASYDRILPELPFYKEAVERHCQAMTQNGIEKVLDIGAGTGNVTIHLIKQGKQVTAVDVGRAMIEKLKSKVDQVSSQRLSVIEDTAERLPHLDNMSFDGVTVLLAFFDMQDPHSALLEAVRVLKPGGTLIVTDPKSCFNVDQLMAAAEGMLKDKGILENLTEDWKRIQTVAPIVNQAIENIQRQHRYSASQTPWHAEAIFESLKVLGFKTLTVEESHLGNCATITGIKPARV